MEDETKKNNKGFDPSIVIEAIPTTKNKVKTSEMMDSHVIPKHPFRGILSGCSGSGKSNLLINLLTNKKFYKNYFDVIFLISPTAGHLDDSYKALEKAKMKTMLCVINDITPDVIEDIMDKNKKLILDMKVHKAPRILMCYDDIISDRKLMNSKSFLHSFVASRHYNASVLICTQRYNSVPRVCRLQANCVFFFKGTCSEQERVSEEYCPPNWKKKEFELVVNHCVAEPYAFFYFNGQADAKHRYRKNLTEILELQK